MNISARRSLRWGLAFLFAASGLTQSLEAWDSPGHEIIAAMAYSRLNPQAQKVVNELARETVNPAQVYDPITISCWMDDLRRDPAVPGHGLFLAWHYINVPIDARDPMPSLVPGTDDDEMHGNVVQALKRAIAVLKGGTDPYIKSKAMAYAITMHLVGDIHQPLHCATKYFFSHGILENDRGGNTEGVLNGPPGERKLNLHAFWDSAWRASFDATTGEVVLDSQYQERAIHDAKQVAVVAASWRDIALPPGVRLEPDIDAWMRESNAIARDFVYRDLTATESKKNCRLSSAYVAKAQSIARDRFLLAAARLATLLNETLGADSKR